MTQNPKESETNGNGQKSKKIWNEAMKLLVQNLQLNMEHIDKNFKYTKKFIDVCYDGIINKRRFFLLASGRSGMILQCYATRLVHLGAEVYMITNLASIPSLRKRDILIVLSGSGTTDIVVSLLNTYVNTVKPFAIISITSHPETIVGRVADITIKLKGRTKKDKPTSDDPHDDTAILTPEGTQFEITAFCYLDSIIAELAIKLGKTNEAMLSQHSEAI